MFNLITAIYSELTDMDFGYRGSIQIKDDSDGKGAYLSKWEYKKPLPKDWFIGITEDEAKLLLS